eukprot:6460222-Amphidinium_carterae.1
MSWCLEQLAALYEDEAPLKAHPPLKVKYFAEDYAGRVQNLSSMGIGPVGAYSREPSRNLTPYWQCQVAFV